MKSHELRFRPAAMVDRIGLEAGPLLPPVDLAQLQAAVHAALLARDPLLDDDHDSRLLHPGRTVLILLRDAGCRSADVLAASAFVESVDRDLTAPLDALRDAAGDAAAALAAAVPLPALAEGLADDDLLERLVTAPEDAALIALAERLDHARHLHLRPELDWRHAHAQVGDAYVPAARRLSTALAARFERWAEAFGRRLLLPPRQR